MNKQQQASTTFEAGVKGSPEQEARMREAVKLAKDAENSELTAGMEVSGRVAEVVGELPPEEVKAGQAAKRQAKVLTIEERIHALEAKLPSSGQMKSEIKREIQKEISLLEEQARKLKRENKFHLLNNVYIKICELTGILASLVEATFEYLKSLWLRYVHGIMI